LRAFAIIAISLQSSFHEIRGVVVKQASYCNSRPPFEGVWCFRDEIGKEEKEEELSTKITSIREVLRPYKTFSRRCRAVALHQKFA
jgi:hypothetical protein